MIENWPGFINTPTKVDKRQNSGVELNICQDIFIGINQSSIESEQRDNLSLYPMKYPNPVFSVPF